MPRSFSEALAGITLPDADGLQVRLGSLWEVRPTVLVSCGTGVEFSARAHRAVARHEQAFKNKGASLAAIGLGDANYARSFREETGIQVPSPDR